VGLITANTGAYWSLLLWVRRSRLNDRVNIGSTILGQRVLSRLKLSVPDLTKRDESMFTGLADKK
jgi:hypothetical protein